jgi:spermidine dehydrogenase
MYTMRAMRDRVTRRDFLNGGALAIGAGLTPLAALRGARGAAAAAAHTVAAYPPAATGERGAAPGTFDVAHALRDGSQFPIDAVQPEESVDLVVVGAGLSGLATAWFYRRERPSARILILDALDDFGGHAQRNEFEVDGRRLIGYGGSESMQSPTLAYSAEALALLRALGVDLDRFRTAFDSDLYPGLGLSRGVLFKREQFGVDRLVTGDPQRMIADDIPAGRMNARPVPEFIGDFPLDEASKRQLIALFAARRDVLAGRPVREKAALLDRTSYRDFLTRYWGLSSSAADTFLNRSMDYYASGIDAVPASWARSTGYPGFAGLGLPADTEAEAEMNDPYIHHFPDGNASLARLLVRALIPGVAPGRDMESIVLAPFDYAKLDAAGNAIRLRLASTVVRVRNAGADPDARSRVVTTYVKEGRLHAVRSRDAIVACFASMTPYVIPEVAAPQREALAMNVKAPLVYVNVAVRNWQPWVDRGVHEVTNPMGFYSRIKLDYPVSLGGYRFPRSPAEPMVLHLVHVPSVPLAGLDLRTAWRAGRGVLLDTPFAAFEGQARDELTRIAGAGGFDAARDIAGITVNRWGHGYSYSSNPLFDEEVQSERAIEIARAPIGRIAIANADAAWSPIAHAAFDEAHRAVNELLA